MNRIQKVARECAVRLMDEGDIKRKWTPEEKRAWTKAFNALQELSGHKIRMPVYRGSK